VLDNKGWGWYFPYLVPFGILAAIMMYSNRAPEEPEKRRDALRD